MALGGALWHLPLSSGKLDASKFCLISLIYDWCIFYSCLCSINRCLPQLRIYRHTTWCNRSWARYLAPIYAAVLAVIILDEQIMFHHLLGAMLILPGLWPISKK